jgi:hypothetical protein
MIAVMGPARLPFVVAYRRHVEVPASETLAPAPIPAAPSLQQQQQPQLSAPGSQRRSRKQDRSTRRGGDNKRQSGETRVADCEAGRSGGAPVVSPPTPPKVKCYLPVREPSTIWLLHWQGKVKSTLHRQVSIFGYLSLPRPKHPSIVVCAFCASEIRTLTAPNRLR